MARLARENAEVLAENLFVPTERWGWQYVDPDPARPSPELRNEPRWAEPGPPDLRGAYARQAIMKNKVVGRVVVVSLIVFLGLLFTGVSTGFGLFVMLIGGALAALWFLPMLNANQSIEALKAKHEEFRQSEWNRYGEAHGRWKGTVAQWDGAERGRRDAADLWYPLELRSAPQRVDVFGGTPDGWAALLCTVGTTLMETGQPLFVVDFTEEDVTGPLCDLAALKGFPVVRQNVPANLEAARLLTGLDAEAIAELIAESVDTMRRGGDDVELRMLDVELVQTVVTRLDGEVTFRRIAAGLLALQQGYDPDRDQRLSAREFQRIVEVVDTVASTERVQNELQFLRGVLDMLPAPRPGEEPPAPVVHEGTGPWPTSGVSVLRTEDDNRRRRDFVDRLLAQVLLQNTRRARHGAGGFVIVLAGADHLGAPTLELLAKRCRQARIRLVLLLEHLRGDLQQLLGGQDSVTFFMRLGNAQEAAAAAEHIGRGHSFLLTQLTRQSGQTDTTGSSTTTGVNSSTTSGTGESRGRTSQGWFDIPSISRQSSTNQSITTGESTSWAKNDSRAISTTDGETVSRVYEFSVEPTKLQSLDITSFLFVESVEGERRVAAGTCDPYVVVMPRVSAAPAAPATIRLPDGPGARHVTVDQPPAALGGTPPYQPHAQQWQQPQHYRRP